MRWQPAQKLALTTDVGALATLRATAPVPAAGGTIVCRDPADQMFIDLALGNRPCWLVTRDKALLALRRRAAAQGVVIATPVQWQREHATEQVPDSGRAQ